MVIFVLDNMRLSQYMFFTRQMCRSFNSKHCVMGCKTIFDTLSNLQNSFLCSSICISLCVLQYFEIYTSFFITKQLVHENCRSCRVVFSFCIYTFYFVQFDVNSKKISFYTCHFLFAIFIIQNQINQFKVSSYYVNFTCFQHQSYF